MRPLPTFTATVPSLLVLLLAACSGLLAACGGSSSSGSSDSGTVRSTRQAVAGTSPVAVHVRWAAYLAEEATTGEAGGATTTDLNGDGDFIDSVVTVLDMQSGSQTVLDAAADPGTLEPLVWIASQLYMAIDEARGITDWSGDGMLDDLVLLHWNAAAGVSFVDELDPTGFRKMVATEDLLVYASADVPAGAMESNLRAIAPTAPTLPVAVPTTDLAGPRVARLAATDEGLVFCLLDEPLQAPAADLNGDGDTADLVLALLDGTAPAGTAALRSTGLAVSNASVPVRARAKSAGDWLVGFLVSEADQDATSLNDPPLFQMSWLPTQCGAGHRDQDHDDFVLHFLHFAAWDADPIGNPPRNTGIAGTQRILAGDELIGTVAQEFKDGESSLNGPCDLNQDGDDLDSVVRWVTAPQDPASLVALPPASDDHFRALAGTPGGVFGLVEFGDLWVAVVSEAQDGVDHDVDGMQNHELVAVRDPGVGGAWDFTHLNGGYAGATWMAQQADGEVVMAFAEESAGVSLNGDMDQTDSVPTFLRLSGGQLTFPGIGIAVDEDDAGIVVAGGLLFYEVDEAADGRDRNGDGDLTDFVTMRTGTSSGFTRTVSVTSGVNGRPAMIIGTSGVVAGGVIVADEAGQGAAGTDFNQDGDAVPNDFVVRWLRF